MILDLSDWDRAFVFLGAAFLVALGVMLLIIVPIVDEPGVASA